ncbi:MAG: sugar phosphate isomerase/epimerase family protein [Verrucomicrobiales bacterium]|nr:sugar phosphate isomerase/epimerase [Verrucomicrobiae bacterium]MCP5554330.1 sugar phosphate isomerase/epimerase [Akkermansiaceae bacterium]
MPARYAICNELFEKRPFDEAFRYARECGYTGVELAPFTMNTDARAIPAEQRSLVRRQIAEAGLECVGLHWLLAFTEGGYYLTSADAEVQRRTAAYLAELARLCADLDGRILVLGSPKQRNLLPGMTHEEAMTHAASVLRLAMPAYEAAGVTLAVEPLGPVEGDFLNTADLGVELMQRVDSPACRLHLDVKAMSTEQKPIPQIIRECAAHTVHFHANDPNLLGPGMGEVDFVPIFQALKDIGYDGWISVEVFDYSPGAEAICEQSLAYMRDVAARTGLDQ